jgi:hypothetical protein
MKKLTLETISNLNQSAIMELFYNEFLNYGKKCALYVAHNHDMTIEYCACYIASGLFELFLTRCEKLHEKENGWEFSHETMLYSFLGTKKLVKKIMASTNYASYFKNNAFAYESDNETQYKMNKQKYSKNKYSEFRNVNKVNYHTIDIVDVLEQKENRTSKKSLSLDNDLYEGVSFRDTLVSYYPTPEQALLNKLAYQYSAITSAKIRNGRKFDRLQSIKRKFTEGVTLANSEVDFIHNFKKRLNLETLSTKELFYIVSNY